MSEQKTDQQYLYHTDQQVSVNAFIEVDLEGENVRFQVTSRYGSTPEKIIKTTQAAIEAYKAIRASYPLPKREPRTTANTTEMNHEPSGESKYTPKPVQHEGLPEGMEAYKEDFDEIEITPQPDEKVNVVFYRDGMKYPVGAKISKWKIATANQALSSLLEQVDLTKPAKVRVAGTQYYTLGSEFTTPQGKKSHYKDLRLIEARF